MLGTWNLLVSLTLELVFILEHFRIFHFRTYFYFRNCVYFDICSKLGKSSFRLGIHRVEVEESFSIENASLEAIAHLS